MCLCSLDFRALTATGKRIKYSVQYKYMYIHIYNTVLCYTLIVYDDIFEDCLAFPNALNLNFD